MKTEPSISIHTENIMQTTNNKKKIIIIIICAAVIIAAGILAVVFMTGNKQVEVPDLTGMSVDQANAQVLEDDLIVKKSDEIESDTVERGKIMSQAPTAGTMVDKNTIILVSISKGVGKGYVPGIIGMTESEAYESLSDAGYEGEAKAIDGVKPAGVVLKQDRKEGAEVEKGEVIGFSVSKGNMVNVPNVCGMWAEDAGIKLNNLGIDVEYKEVDSKKDFGTIVKQSRVGAVYYGTKVTLSYSAGDD